MEQLLEFAPEAAIATDKAGTILFVNALAEAMYGYQRGELVGRPLMSVIPPEDREATSAHREGYAQDPTSELPGTVLSFTGMRADGTRFPVELTLSSVDTERGRIAMAAIRDVSERVEAEAERKRQDDEIHLNDARRLDSVAQHARGIAHDFNNLLGVIMSHAYFAECSARDKADLESDLRAIQTAAARATNLTQQLMVFSRGEVIAPEPLDLNELLDELNQMLMQTRTKTSTVNIKLQPDIWSIVADRGQISQLVVNLAFNARDAMPGGGVAEAGVENIEITEQQARDNPEGPAAGRYVRLSVTDHGHGMTPEVQARACEPFFTTKDETKGAGLGLATVHDIVRRAGGSISFESSPGQGTTASALFPASDLPVHRRDGTGEAPTDSDPQSTPLQRTRLASAIREVIERSTTPRGS